MAEIVYMLCALTSCLCAALLLRAYWKTKARLLLWSSLCFVCLGLNNILLFIDLAVVPDVGLGWARAVVSLSGMLILLYGLIWEQS